MKADNHDIDIAQQNGYFIRGTVICLLDLDFG